MSVAAVEAQLPGDRISKRNFDKLARFIYDYSGIKMPPTKLTMLEGRLRRRLRATHHSSFDDYCDFLFDHGGLEQETVYLIDVVTTNKTDFFREPQHFTFLRDVAIPALLKGCAAWPRASSTRNFLIYSARGAPIESGEAEQWRPATRQHPGSGRHPRQSPGAGRHAQGPRA